jgi:two-component system CheB/CheR fusion protein
MVPALEEQTSGTGQKASMRVLRRSTWSLRSHAANDASIWESVFQTPLFGVCVLDADSRILQANRAMCELLGFDREHLSATRFTALADARDRGALNLALRLGTTANSPNESLGRRLVAADGSVINAVIDVRPLPHRVGTATAIAIVRDVTESEQISRLLAHQAQYDAGTGLANRDYFRDALEREIAAGKRSDRLLALVWIDLDHFKEINDQHGHAAGDVVLRACAQRLESVVRREHIVGRLGGDEFGIIVSQLSDPNEVDPLLERIISAIREPIVEGTAQLTVGASLGVSFHPLDGQSADSLMRAADQAMYSAKDVGGDRYAYFQSEMNDEADKRRNLRIELATAISTGQFVMHYQPIRHVGTGAVAIVEALVRGVLGSSFVDAKEFIQFAERSGQIRDLRLLTLALVRTDIDALRAAGRANLQVAFNMSVSQLEDARFVDLIHAWPSVDVLTGLAVEVTEEVFLPDHLRAVDALLAVSSQGVAISIDDFGSGFSNLRLLQVLAPETLKLDPCFLVSNDESEPATELLRAAINLGHALGAQVVVEGVETHEHLVMATALGADLVQGYFIARPMPLAELLVWLEVNEK